MTKRKHKKRRLTFIDVNGDRYTIRKGKVVRA
jgi:hypothetical protein